MKYLIIITTYFLFTLLTSAQDKGDLKISFEDFQDPQGKIYIAVFQKDNFLRQPTKTAVLEVKAEGNQEIIKDLVYGEYAVSVFHDLNGNQKFDMTENQMPAEPWAMSGSVNPMQMPTFEAAKFKFDSEEQSIALKLIK
jgi:uncharacterized protein (DUF2141 family)